MYAGANMGHPSDFLMAFAQDRRAQRSRVPHISVVFREMWVTTELNLALPKNESKV
jgi:hypothetical protein